MTKLSTILLCLITCFHVQAQSFDSTIIKPSEIRSFFNSISNTPYFKSQVLIVSTPSELNKNLLSNKKNLFDSIFSIEDIHYIEAQINASQNLKWDSVFIDSVSFTTKDFLDSLFKANRKDGNPGWTTFRKVMKKGSYYNISFPCFSKDRQYCLVYLSHTCGLTCGEGRLGIFKLQEGQWTLIKTLTLWLTQHTMD